MKKKTYAEMVADWNKRHPKKDASKKAVAKKDTAKKK
jgi:hypothetical protein